MTNVAILDSGYEDGLAILDSGYESEATPIDLIWDLDSANLDPNNFSVTDEETETPNIFIKPRLTSSNDADLWIHWGGAVTGMNGKRPLFELDAVRRWWSGGTHYVSSWRPWYSYDRETWTQFPAPTLLTSPLRARFQLATAFNQDTVYICDHIPYRQEYFEALAADLVADNSGLVSVGAAANGSGVIGTSPAENDELSRSVGEHPIFGFVLGDPNSATEDGEPKRRMLVLAGLHAGEMTDGWALQGLVDFYLNGTGSLADTLRANWLIGLYFCANPNGRFGGHYRGNWRSTKDPNHDWIDEDFAETTILKTAIAADLDGAEIDAAFDLHNSAGASVAHFAYNYASLNSIGVAPAFLSALNTVDSTTWSIESSAEGSFTFGTFAKNLGARVVIIWECGTRQLTTTTRNKQIGQRFLEATAAIDQEGRFYVASGEVLVDEMSDTVVFEGGIRIREPLTVAEASDTIVLDITVGDPDIHVNELADVVQLFGKTFILLNISELSDSVVIRSGVVVDITNNDKVRQALIDGLLSLQYNDGLREFFVQQTGLSSSLTFNDLLHAYLVQATGLSRTLPLNDLFRAYIVLLGE